MRSSYILYCTIIQVRECVPGYTRESVDVERENIKTKSRCSRDLHTEDKEFSSKAVEDKEEEYPGDR